MNNYGYQIFVIHPDSHLRNQLVKELRIKEFETFGIPDRETLALIENPNTVAIYACSEDGTCEDSSNFSEYSIGKWIALGTHQIPDGYDSALPGKEPVKEILLYLDSINARGHRHYVRFGNYYASIASFNFRQDEIYYSGIVHAISIAGMSCSFRIEPAKIKDTYVEKMNLYLPGYDVEVKGRFTIDRVVSGQSIHVFMFDGEIPIEIRDCIYDFIYASLESIISPS